MTASRPRSLQSRLLQSHLAMVLALVPALLLLGGWLVWVPILHSATTDFATLIHDDIQTLTSLPAYERAPYAQLMAKEHGLYVMPEPTAGSGTPLFLPYLHYLEQALAHRFTSVSPIHSIQAPIEGYGFTVQTTQGPISLGFSHDRIGTAPVLTLVAMAAITLLLAMLGAHIQARRLARPIETLRHSARDLGTHPKATIAADSGVQELDDLASTLNKMQEQIHELVEQRSLLLAGVSHDLRTPLTRLGLALELARENPESARFERMSTYLDDMRQLIDSFISFTQIHVRETTECFRPSVVVRTVLQQRVSTLGLIMPVFSDDPLLNLNRLALTRILSNFLDNADKHGQGEVTVVQYLRAGVLRIEIGNRGRHLSADDCRHAFEPFLRLDPARSPQTLGAGLGLAIVRDLSRTQGWQVGLEPRESGGVTAWIDIPVDTAAPVYPDKRPSPSNDPPAAR